MGVNAQIASNWYGAYPALPPPPPCRGEGASGVPGHPVWPAGAGAGEPARPAAAGRGGALGGPGPQQGAGAAAEGVQRAAAQTAADITTGRVCVVRCGS